MEERWEARFESCAGVLFVVVHFCVEHLSRAFVQSCADLCIIWCAIMLSRVNLAHQPWPLPRPFNVMVDLSWYVSISTVLNPVTSGIAVFG